MVKMDQAWQGDMDRRSSLDRRRKGIPSIRSIIVYRRRRYLRRASDRRGLALFDYYHPPLLLSIILILVLSVVDAFLTLFLMDYGAVELNPIMAFFIELGNLPFFAAKYALTVFFVCTVVIFNYYFFRNLKIFTRDLLHIFSLGFAMVIVWELFLAFRYVI
jgi:hypothetical protein